MYAVEPLAAYEIMVLWSLSDGKLGRLEEAPTGPDAAVIWLHGLGDTGEGWSDVGPQLQQRLPSAPGAAMAAAAHPS